jgi:GntR family transcriptional regulator
MKTAQHDSTLDVFDLYNPLAQESLTEQTANRIRSMINDGRLAPGDRLPNEHKLAEAMGVSRGTIRSALHLLQQQGLVWRRQGMGSFVSEKPILENRLDMNLGVTDLIESMGLEPGCNVLDITVIPADELFASQMQVPEKTPLVRVKRVRTADGQPVVASIDIFPLSILTQGSRSMDINSLKEALLQKHSIYKVFEQDLHLLIEYGIAKLHPVKVDAAFINEFDLLLSKGSIMLYMEQIDFDRNRQPVNLSFEYHVADFCTFTVYRRR